jgi:hypothetical protein
MAKLANIPANCEFPQLHDIADTAKLAQKLNQHLGPAFASGEMQAASCTIDQLNYQPRAGCQILFTATICDRHQHRLGQQSFYGKLFRRPQRAKRVWQRQQQKTWAPPPFGPPVLHLPELAMMLWAYPNDPNLPGLARLVDTEKILAEAQAAPKKFGLSQAPIAITAQRTKYVPGQRCGYVYRLKSADGATFSVYGKAYQSGEGKKVFALMQEIWESDACQSGRFVLPQPYGYDADSEVIWQEAISGEPLAKIAETIPNLPEMAEAIGARLAAFHSLRLQLPLERTFEAQVEETRQTLAAISKAFPDYAERCGQIGEKLLAAANKLGPGPVTPVHASFKFSHIFATAKGIAFIDFDGACLGDPAYDVGRFIAHLYKMKANWKIDPEIAEQTITNFCVSYNRAAAAPLPPERINWFAASHLIASQVYKSVKRLDASLVSKLLKVAEHLIIC